MTDRLILACEKAQIMEEPQRSEYLNKILEEEVDKVIMSAPPQKREQLRLFHNRARMQVQASKNPVDAMVRTNNLMMESFFKLNESLSEFRK